MSAFISMNIHTYIYTIKHSPNFILSVFQSMNQWFQSNLFSFYFQCLKANIRTKACSHAARVVSPKFLVDSGVQLTLTPRSLRHLYCNLKSRFVRESVHVAAMITKLLLQRVRLCSWGSHRTAAGCSVAFLLVLFAHSVACSSYSQVYSSYVGYWHGVNAPLQSCGTTAPSHSTPAAWTLRFVGCLNPQVPIGGYYFPLSFMD